MKKYLFRSLFLYYLLLPFFLFCQTDSSLDQQDTVPTVTETRPSRYDSSYPLIYDHPDEQGHAHVPMETDNFQSKFFNMLFILGLLIGFMILASYMLKRMMRTRVTQMNEASVVKIVETRTLSPRTTLYVIEVQGKELLIAESHTGVSTLATLDSSVT